MNIRLILTHPTVWASIAYSRPRWLARLILKIYRNTPEIHKRESVRAWRSRATWHCPTCSEGREHGHERNDLGD